MFLVTLGSGIVPGSKSIGFAASACRAPAIGQHDAQTLDPAPRGPVLEAARSAGIGGDGSTDASRCFGGVGRIKLAGPLRGGVQIAEQNSGPAIAWPSLTSRRVSLSSEITHPPKGTRAPVTPVPAPATVTGISAALASRSASHTPASSSGMINRSAWPR